MADLPGWDRRRLATAQPSDVAAARWIVYARQFRDLLGRDFRTELGDLDASDDPTAMKRRDRARRARVREALTQLWRMQSAIRARLGLDAIEEAPGG